MTKAVSGENMSSLLVPIKRIVKYSVILSFPLIILSVIGYFTSHNNFLLIKNIIFSFTIGFVIFAPIVLNRYAINWTKKYFNISSLSLKELLLRKSEYTFIISANIVSTILFTLALSLILAISGEPLFNIAGTPILAIIANLSIFAYFK